MRRPTAKSLVIILAAIGALGTIFFTIMSSTNGWSPRAAPESVSPSGQDVAGTGVERLGQVGPPPSAPVVSQARTGLGAARRPEQLDEAREIAPEAEFEELLDSFRSALEATVYERINPGELLAVAQRIVELDTDLKASSVPTIDGGVRFELVDGPKGLKAALEVHRSNIPEFANILSLEIKCDELKEPTFLEGTRRRAPSMNVMVWSDSEGEPLHVTMRTSIKPTGPQTQHAGVDINSGTIHCGVVYHLDVKAPLNSGLQSLVMTDGLLSDVQVPTILDGAEWPQFDKIGHFSSSLLALHHSLSK